MDADGSNLKRLTEGEEDFRPNCSQAGKLVYYYDGGVDDWMRVPLEGGKPESLPSVVVPGSPNFPIFSITRDDAMLVVYGSVPDPSTSTYMKKLGLFKTICFAAPVQILTPDSRIVILSVQPRFTPDGLGVV